MRCSSSLAQGLWISSDSLWEPAVEFDIIAFDADDTLWHSEILYVRTQEKLAKLLSAYADEREVEERLLRAEEVNIGTYGYGVKSFTLSMIESAIDLSDAEIPAADIARIIGFGREMLTTETRLLEHAKETVSELARSFRLMMITKGDLLDQKAKLARSGLAHYFEHVEVDSHKDEGSYRALLAKYGIRPERFLMVGNSLKSDVLPVLSLGGHAVYIPHPVTWALERSSEPLPEGERFHRLEHLGQLPELIERLVDG
jgi:putative hydrolase of the HAD superfamily